MKFTGLKYISSCLDYSGYGNAARQNILALDKHIPVTALNVSFASNESLIPQNERDKIKEIINRKIDYSHVLIQLTPENFPRFIEKDKINIGNFYWETSKLHQSWVPCCNLMDLILAPCRWNVDVFKDSGVEKPVFFLPPIYDTEKFNDVKPLKFITDEYAGKFKFYSIFQWTERKNPGGLLRAYYSTFSDKDDVVLILKTYSGSGGERDKRFLINEVNKIKESVNKKNLPPVRLFPDLLSDDVINQIHVSCDCYLAPVKGEGFGMPILDAVLAEKQIIATNYSGHLDFLDKKIHHLIPYQLTHVTNMPWIPWYMSNQYWADPNLVSFSSSMINIYEKWKNKESFLPRDKSITSEKYSEYLNETKRFYKPENVTKMLVDLLEKM